MENITFPQWFIGITRTCLILSLSFLVASSVPLEWHDGVIVQKIGSGFLFIFPSTQGRITASDNPSGTITIGKTITVQYALKIIRMSRARFIGIDGSPLPPDMISKLKPVLTVQKAEKTFGFMIRDANNPKLDIHINPSFMAEVGTLSQEQLKQIHDKVARQGNLTVIIGPSHNDEPMIVAAILD